jgi:CBS-domain-containing membrane protein
MSESKSYTETRIRDIMVRDVFSLPMTATIGDAVQAFAHHRVGGFPVVDDNDRVCAWVSDGDIVHYVIYNMGFRKFKRRSDWTAEDEQLFADTLDAIEGQAISECISSRVYFANSDDTLRATAERMKDKRLKYMPVLDGGVLVGMVSRNNIIRTLFKEYAQKLNA